MTMVRESPPESDYRVYWHKQYSGVFVCLSRPYSFVVSPPRSPPHHYDDIRSPLIHDMREEIWKYQGAEYEYLS